MGKTIATDVDFRPRLLSSRVIERETATSEALRICWRDWVGGMPFGSFGTLTLRNRFDDQPSGVKKWSGEVSSKLPGYVPGMQATETAVVKFVRRHLDAMVVEEYGPIWGRRHFHYMVSGGLTPETCDCRRCDGGYRSPTHSHSSSPVEIWQRDMGAAVVSDFISDRHQVARYITKTLTAYITKGVSDENGYVKHASVSINEPRIWIKRGRRRAGHDADVANDERRRADRGRSTGVGAERNFSRFGTGSVGGTIRSLHRDSGDAAYDATLEGIFESYSANGY